MMKLAVMQPYLFPYLGYFKLVGMVDRFVFLDDVNFISRGWINRNQLLISGCVRYFTVPLESASQNSRICDLHIATVAGWKRKLEGSIRQSYIKAPYFEPVYEIVAKTLFGGDDLIGEMAKKSVTAITQYLGLPTQFVWSASAYNNNHLKGEERILDICRQERPSIYFNLPGGRELYNADSFRSDGVHLAFIEPQLSPYPQFSDHWHPGLSIIDVMMHNDPEEIRNILQ